MNARIFMHDENEHMNVYVFTDLVSKFKLKRTEKGSRMKMIKRFTREVRDKKMTIYDYDPDQKPKTSKEERDRLMKKFLEKTIKYKN